MKHLLLLLFIFLLSIPLATADSIYGIGGYAFEGNFTFDNMTTEPDDIVLGISSDFFNRVNNTDMNTNTGKTKWQDGGSGGFEISNNMAKSQGGLNRYSYDLDIPLTTSNYNSSIEYQSTSANYDVSLYFYLQSNTSYNNGYYIDIRDDSDIVSYRVRIGGSSALLDSYLGTVAIGDTFTVDTSTISTGLKLYKNGVLVDTFIANSSFSNGTCAIYGLNDVSIVDNYRTALRNDGNCISPIENATTGYQAKWFMINGTFGDGVRNVNVLMRNSTDNSTWSSYYTIQTNISSETRYGITTNQSQYWQLELESSTTNVSLTPIIETVILENEVSAGSVDITYRELDYSNLTANVLIDISNKTEPLTYINLTHIGNLSSEYCLVYPNGTAVQACITCTGEGDVIWFNGSADRLPELNGYYINESLGKSTMTIPANSWGIFNNWTETTTFAAIAANESNDVCYTYYNVTSGLWESYYVGYNWNSDYQLSKDASVMGYFNAQTDITSNIITPSSTELYTGWNMVALQGSNNQTISGIIADIGANCSDSWYFNSSTGAYLNTTTHSIQPNQGFLTYITQNMTWSRSAM